MSPDDVIHTIGGILVSVLGWIGLTAHRKIEKQDDGLTTLRTEFAVLKETVVTALKMVSNHEPQIKATDNTLGEIRGDVREIKATLGYVKDELRTVKRTMDSFRGDGPKDWGDESRV